MQIWQFYTDYMDFYVLYYTTEFWGIILQLYLHLNFFIYTLMILIYIQKFLSNKCTTFALSIFLCVVGCSPMLI